jgi:hypothetical protein
VGKAKYLSRVTQNFTLEVQQEDRTKRSDQISPMFSFDHRSLPPTFGFLSLFFALPQSYLNKGEELGRGNSLVLEKKKGKDVGLQNW